MDYVAIIGFSAAICTTAAFLPQAIKTLKTKSTKDISLIMYLLFCIGVFLWLIYGLYLNSYPIILANIITLVLALIVLTMKIIYN
jgi:MtN3 and saliva related transmembrane protein